MKRWFCDGLQCCGNKCGKSLAVGYYLVIVFIICIISYFMMDLVDFS
jgi:tetrahydromethanopterin S-methyltransferase subunit G